LDVKPNVELRIEELVLYGFPSGIRHRIGYVVERELSRLFTDRGVPLTLAAGGEVSLLEAGEFRAGLGVEEIGARVAEAVYDTIEGSSEQGGV
jgi:hypothetical protein